MLKFIIAMFLLLIIFFVPLFVVDKTSELFDYKSREKEREREKFISKRKRPGSSRK